MTELSFTKSFLTTLDSRPGKIAPDHVEDPHSFPPRGAYTLPKISHPMTKRQKLIPGQEKLLTATIKSLRNPPIDITLKSQSPLVSVLDIKSEVSSQSRIPVDKIKVLHKKKPVADAKVLKDLVGEDDSTVEFTIMVIGGSAAISSEQTSSPVVAVGLSGEDVIDTEEFWIDLKGFLVQRLRDESIGEFLVGAFRKTWEATRNKP